MSEPLEEFVAEIKVATDHYERVHGKDQCTGRFMQKIAEEVLKRRTREGKRCYV